jgi:endonuclease/exonuclease/phosphatase family metal-dependent hydrolase
MVLPAVAVIATLETFRVLFPSAYGLADRRGDEAAAVAMVAVFASSLLTPVLRRLLGPSHALAATAGTLAVWRIAVQLFDDVPLVLAVPGPVVALAAVSLVLTTGQRSEAALTTVAILGGLGLDVAVRTVFLTWEPAWQRGPGPLLFGVLLSAALGASAVSAVGAGRPPADGRRAAVTGLSGGVAMGAVLAVEFLFLASPSFVASSARVSLSWAALVVAAGIAVAIAAFVLTLRSQPSVVVAAAAGLATLGFLLPHSVGWPVLFAVAAGQCAAGTVLAGAVRPRGRRRLGAELGVALGWLVFALTVLLYQLHFDQPLPFDNAWVVAGAGALTVVAAVGRRGELAGRPAVGTTASVCAFVLVAGLVGCGFAGARTRGATTPAPGRSLRVMEWNVRQAVTENAGQLDPARIESVLTADGAPDIVVLLEVARGWPLSGDLDLASWLSRHLDLPFVWGPAADQQFGTVVFSRLPIVSSRVRKLPVAGRAQGRSLVQTVVDLGGGQRLTVLATHLQHRNDESSMAARMKEIDVIVGQWARAHRTVLVGDFNPRQGDPPRYPPRRPGEFPEVRAILDAGFATAQDLTECSQPTSASNCSDFVFATADIDQQVHVLQDVTGFDHRPVMSAIQVR